MTLSYDKAEITEKILNNLFRWSKIRLGVNKSHPSFLIETILNDYRTCRPIIVELTELILTLDDRHVVDNELLCYINDKYCESDNLINTLEENLLLSVIANVDNSHTP